MKRILTSLILGVSLALISVLPASAAHFWEIKSSVPKATSQARTLKIEFVALSRRSDDQITVKLFENDIEKSSKTTIPGGDSGEFTVTVPSDGTYKYYMIAESSLDAGTTKKTPDQNVTVNTQGTTSTVTVVQAPATGTTASSTTGGTTGTGTGTATTTGTPGTTSTTGPSVQGASIGDGTNQAGQVGTEGTQSSEANETGDVLGSEKVKDSSNTSAWVLPTLGVLALAGLLYNFVYRAGRWPFHSDKS